MKNNNLHSCEMHASHSKITKHKNKVGELNLQLFVQRLDVIKAPSQHSTVQSRTIRYSKVQYRTVQYSTVQYSTVQYSTEQYSTVQ